LGTRLDPLTRLVAKPAMPLGGRTLIERVLGWLATEHIGQVVLNLHHLPESICGVVGDGTHLGLSVKYSWESPLLGSAGGPRHALPLLDADEFLIVNGDTLCEVPLETLLAAHRATGADVTLAVVPNPNRAHYNGIVAEEDGRVSSFIARGHTADSWHFVGIQVVKSSVFASLPDNVPMESVAGIYRERLYRGEGRIFVFPVRAPFFDIGTPRDYVTAARALVPVDEYFSPGAEVSPQARVLDTLVWPGSVVGARASLDGCVVAGAHVPEGFQASGVMLLPAGVLRPGDAATTTDGVAMFPMSPNLRT
jgi:mannose-1-phosphate guanylyltransferase